MTTGSVTVFPQVNAPHVDKTVRRERGHRLASRALATIR
jgi:hypothetical protein